MSHRAMPAELFDHAAWVFALARRLVGDADADDVTQEVLVAALRRPPVADRPLRPWLGEVARRLAGKWTRGDRRRRRRETIVARTATASASAAPSPADLAETADTLRLLLAELAGLDEPLRDVVTLRYMQGLDATEIGARLGIPSGTVRWRLHRAIEKLRSRLDAQHGGDRSAWAGCIVAALGVRDPATLAVASGVLVSKSKLAVAALLVVALGAGSWYGIARSADETRPFGDGLGGIAADGRSVVAGGRARAPSTPAEHDDRDGVRSHRVSVPTTPTSPALPAGVAGVTLRVVDADTGIALSNVVLEWRAQPDAFGIAAADGRVGLRVRPPADAAVLPLHLSCNGYATRVLDARIDVGVWTDLGEIALPKAGWLRGKVHGAVEAEHTIVFVTDASLAGHPADYSQLGPPAWREFEVASATVARDGHFELRDVPNVPIRVWTVDRAAQFVGSEPLRIGTDRRVDPAEHLDVELTRTPLAATTIIEGQLIDAFDRPVCGGDTADGGLGARVRLAARRRALDDPAGLFRPRWFLVDAEGHFAVPAREGIEYELRAEAIGWRAVTHGHVRAGSRITVRLLERDS